MLKIYVAAKTQLENLKDRFVREEGGASLIEYSILIGLITVAAVAGVKTVGTWVAGQWSNLNGTLA